MGWGGGEKGYVKQNGKRMPHTCNAKTLKFCLTVNKLKKWICYTLDVNTAYLQGDKIQ